MSQSVANGHFSIWWIRIFANKWMIRHCVYFRRQKHWVPIRWTKASHWNSKMIQLCRPPFRLQPVTVWWTFPKWCKPNGKENANVSANVNVNVNENATENRTRPANETMKICIRKFKWTTTAVTTMAVRIAVRRRHIKHIRWTNRWTTTTWARPATEHVSAHRLACSNKTTTTTRTIFDHKWHTRTCHNIIISIKYGFDFATISLLDLILENWYMIFSFPLFLPFSLRHCLFSIFCHGTTSMEICAKVSTTCKKTRKWLMSQLQLAEKSSKLTNWWVLVVMLTLRFCFYQNVYLIAFFVNFVWTGVIRVQSILPEDFPGSPVIASDFVHDRCW